MMLRRLNNGVTSRSLTMATGVGLSIAGRCFQQSRRSGLPAVKETTTMVAPTFCMSRRGFSLQPLRHMRGVKWVKPVTSPMNYGGDNTGGGSTADSLTPYVRQHLSRVYGLLAAGTAVAGIGSFLMFSTPLGKAMPFWLPMVGGFVPLLWLSFAPPQDPNLKLALFFSFTVLEGMALAPLVAITMAKGVLGTAIVLTGAVFFGFSAAALLAPRASLLALQGPLFGMLMGMVAISILNLFYPTAFAHSLILYGGLALFSLFVSVDTQAMIERARCGAGDHVQDALQMFLNVVNIFVRIAQILGSMDR
ncbi:hypothetical protein C3747_212g46 [Trypanosoma cruzi]|uniref:Inhibitor of apoptosis-promoting Bax1 n=2 Tax=Trypanosoma cruzi TaxID=5693 RepID=Q4DZH5_TRYCC|nr:hypothetical protein, conserved [Trypanosoma cruzi]EAN97926.1 hypothetical protein, conserved [Trypanosoma cruzi]PWU99963.1 hypothetical protein C3747_212g46 [Trypanosoma cruzi]RNC45798.1 hypothetical protein TcCL_NonESM04427 [Trypanosoma cruzi]|eukprot:XP_819777.1 hypothetical protein [Trypanosoma cruzi strain CL Brener]